MEIVLLFANFLLCFEIIFKPIVLFFINRYKPCCSFSSLYFVDLRKNKILKKREILLSFNEAVANKWETTPEKSKRVLSKIFEKQIEEYSRQIWY